jgi:DNA-directed RNA polymerase
LKPLDDKNRRKLFKGPVMTFPYSATVDGMRDKIVEVYAGLFENEPPDDAATFLARAVRLACRDVLPLPCGIMDYIRNLARHRLKQGKFLEWRSLSGFPFVNVYQHPKIVPLDLRFGIRSRYKVADGATSKVKKEKMLNAASPNFIHSLDAAHLICTVLAANREGIHDILTVHDSYSCLAPFARRFGQITRREMAMLHVLDPLAALSKANGDPLPLPKRGNLDPLALQKGEYSFM